MAGWRRGVLATLGGAVVAALLAGTVPDARADQATPIPDPSASASSSASPTPSATSATPSTTLAPTPTATPTPGATGAAVPAHLRPNVTLDRSSTISVGLAGGSVAVRFRSGVAKKRPVSLQRLVNGAWVQIAKRTMDSKGRVSFSAGAYQSASLYRAVALTYKVKGRSVPLRATRTSGWSLGFEDQFGGTRLDETKWSLREWANKGPRYCSRTTSQRATVSGGSFVASVAYMSDEALAAEYHATALRVQKQGCWWGWEKSPVGLGVFDTAMITTEDHYVVNTAKPGAVAARVKYADAQGMHGAVWLTSPGKGEIDITEGFGYGLGISSYIHTASKKTLDAAGPTPYKLGAYVIPQSTKRRSWWAKYHTYSVEWTATSFTFRVDGKVTRTVKIVPGNVDYSLILSHLVSDWEAYRVTAPVKKKGFKDVKPATLPVQMDVDWVKVWTKA
jgi:hypothetical protein